MYAVRVSEFEEISEYSSIVISCHNRGIFSLLVNLTTCLGNSPPSDDVKHAYKTAYGLVDTGSVNIRKPREKHPNEANVHTVKPKHTVPNVTARNATGAAAVCDSENGFIAFNASGDRGERRSLKCKSRRIRRYKFCKLKRRCTWLYIIIWI